MKYTTVTYQKRPFCDSLLIGKNTLAKNKNSFLLTLPICLTKESTFYFYFLLQEKIGKLLDINFVSSLSIPSVRGGTFTQ